jgi:hypothetical protein
MHVKTSGNTAQVGTNCSKLQPMQQDVRHSTLGSSRGFYVCTKNKRSLRDFMKTSVPWDVVV